MKDTCTLIFRFNFTSARVVLIFSVILLLAIGAEAQSRRLNDGSTPLGIAPGSPAGSFSLSDFDTINPYNGNLNFRLPLINIGGRGNSGYTVTLPINHRWTVFHQYLNQNQDFQHHPKSYRPSYAVKSDYYKAGKFEVRACREGSWCGSGEPNAYTTLTTITFTAADGTEYEFRSEALNGSPAGALCVPDSGASRGTVWKTSDGSFLTFVSDTEMRDESLTGEHQFDMVKSKWTQLSLRSFYF